MEKLPEPRRARIEETYGKAFSMVNMLPSFIPLLRKAVRHLRKERPETRDGKVGCVGFCMGGGPARIDEETLELYISQRIEASAGVDRIHFEWHGGEPTILGLDYFKSIARLQHSLGLKGRSVTNGIQTNGLLLDEAWAEFFAREKWSVGLSLDGPEETYEFFHSLGVRFLQFLPLVTPASGPNAHAAAVTPEAVGEFLCRVFDAWIAGGVGRIVIQTFDEALRPIYGYPHALCIHSETCGNVAVLERDGSLYACDHFVDPEHRIGNIRDRDLESLFRDPRLIAFGAEKAGTLPRSCRACPFLASCNGGCPKDRIVPDPEGGFPTNYLCTAYKRFFAHAKPALESLAAHIKAGKPLRDFSAESRQ